jgi:hypothetical protein
MYPQCNNNMIIKFVKIIKRNIKLKALQKQTGRKK